MEIEEIKEVPRKKRRVSLFKKRRKSDIRPLVRAKKNLEYKKIIAGFIVFIVVISIFSAALYFIRFYLIEPLIAKNTQIITPQGRSAIDNNQAKEIIESGRLAITDIQFITNSEIITFTLNKKTQVLLTKGKDIAKQMDLVEAIDREIVTSSKQAISIDLRYNKPIVKF